MSTEQKIRKDVRDGMRQTCTLTGMILKSAPAGEYDKRITILTRERGKVTAFARGARRAKSSLQAATDLFCFGKFEAYEGRDAYTVVRAEIRNYFRELHTDLEKVSYGCYFLEVADHFTRPDNNASDQLKLLYQTVRALSVKSLDPRLVRRIYELKTLVFYGVGPQVFSCVSCGKREDLCVFSQRRHGMLCGACCGKEAERAKTDCGRTAEWAKTNDGRTAERAKTAGSWAAGRRKENGRKLGAASLYTLQYIVSSPVEKLYTFMVTDEVLAEVSAVVEQYMAPYVDREFYSLSLLE
ncbi:MAG: DNA repair protein RecO [Lachnospiraceae bacterium]|nr:DNA repair protein RecO [Lachnospiraceae bacterium]